MPFTFPLLFGVSPIYGAFANPHSLHIVSCSMFTHSVFRSKMASTRACGFVCSSGTLGQFWVTLETKTVGENVSSSYMLNPTDARQAILAVFLDL